ncbi:MAG: TonB-dependent receptor [Bacteroidota bacterium]
MSRLLGLFVLLSNLTYGQGLLINYSVQDKPLSQALNDLEKEYDLYFAFSRKELQGLPVTINAKNTPIDEFFKELLNDHQLSFERIEEKFISIKKPESVFIRARVFDAITAESLPFATLKIKGTHLGAVADGNGYFNVIIPEPINAVLEFSFLGYSTAEFNVEEYEAGISLEVAMESSSQELNEVLIKEYLNNGISTNNSSSRITIKPQEMEILPGLSERDIFLSTQILAGINSNDESAGGLNIRGSARDNTFIYWNNIPIYQPAHYFGNISSFIPSSIGEVNIYKNYIPVQYGGASAGLILADSRENMSDTEFEAGVNMTHGDFYANLPLSDNKSSLMLAGRTSYNNLIATPTFNSISDKLFDGTLTQDIQQDLTEGNFEYNSRLTFSDINVRWVYEPVGSDKITVSALRSASVLDYNSSNDEDQSIQDHFVRNLGFNTRWNHRWGEKFQTDLSVSLTDYQMEYSLTNLRTEEDETDNDQQTRFNELRNLEIRWLNTLAIAPTHILDFGYQLNHMSTDLTIEETNFLEEDFSEIINSEGFVHSLFTNYEGKTKSGWHLGLGLRASSYETLNEVALDPQLRLSYELTNDILIKSTYGISHQHLSALLESEFSFSNTIERHWILADRNETVPLVINRQFVFGFLYDKKGWLVDTEFYSKDIEGIIARNFIPDLIEEDGLSPGSEQIFGLDFTIRRKWKNFRSWLSYSFQDSSVELPELELNDFVSALNLRHQLQVSQTWKLNRYEFSLGFAIKTGVPFTNAEGLTFVDTPDPDDEPDDDFEEPEEEFEPFYEIRYGETNANRLPVYRRLDFSVWYKFPKNTTAKFNGELGISVLNVLNRKNLYSRAFTVDQDENENAAVFRNDRALLGFTPNVSVRIRF